MMLPDIYNPQPRDNTTEGKVSDIKEDYYREFPDCNSDTLRSYKEKKIPFLTIPPNLLRNSHVWQAVFERYIEEPTLFSEHTLNSHPADCYLALQVVKDELGNGNVMTSVKDCSDINKCHEGTRIIVGTRESVIRELPRYLHLQMALEIAQQVENGNITNSTLLENLRRIGRDHPAFTTLIGCQLMNLVPITKNLNIKEDDIFETIPQLTKNRGDDKRIVRETYYALQRGNLFSKLQNEKAIKILLEKFPEQREDLYRSGTFKEKISPVIVFESSFNRLKSFFSRKNVPFNTFNVTQIGSKLEDSITSEIVTAYVQHETMLANSLGPINIMLRNETLTSYPSTPPNDPYTPLETP